MICCDIPHRPRQDFGLLHIQRVQRIASSAPSSTSSCVRDVSRRSGCAADPNQCLQAECSPPAASCGRAPTTNSFLKTNESQDAELLRFKCASLQLEFMYARSLLGTRDMIEQHPMLNRGAEPVDTGTIRTTLSRRAGSINFADLKKLTNQSEAEEVRGRSYWKVSEAHSAWTADGGSCASAII
jgi:hypothetical protein